MAWSLEKEFLGKQTERALVTVITHLFQMQAGPKVVIRYKFTLKGVFLCS